MMDDLKILFADLYRHTAAIKDETKEMAKNINVLMDQTDWNEITMCADSIASIAARIKAYGANMEKLVDKFLQDGPYEGQSAGITPLESLGGRR